MKVLVIGFDGATWNILEPLVKKNKLPNLKNLLSNSTSGKLESSIPHVTFPAWRCYSSGKNPGKLGVYGFHNVDLKNKKVKPNNSKSFKSKDIWDYLGKNNISCGVLNLPGTFPPFKINGFLVSHSLINTEGFTYPNEIENGLNDLNYKLTPNFLYHENPEKCITSVIDTFHKRIEAIKYLINTFSSKFVHITFFYTDHIQHYYWKEWENPNSSEDNAIEKIWIELDKGIKDLMDFFVDSNTYVILMSDHGFCKVKGEFALGKWLLDKGYLKLNINGKVTNLFSKIGINTNLSIKILKKIRIYELLRRIIPDNLKLKIYNSLPQEKGILTSPGGSNFDWQKSKVLPLMGFYINKSLFDTENEFTNFKNKFIEELIEIKTPDANDRLFKGVYTKESLYTGKYVNLAPDIITLPNGYTHPPKYTSNKLWEFSDLNWSGHHELHGIFLAHGPGIKKNQKIENAKIYDLAPTILHLFGLPIPNDMDGRVLTELFEEDSELIKRKPKYVDPSYYDSDKKEHISNKINKLKETGKI